MKSSSRVLGRAEQDFRAEVFHQLSQPLSVLECGLELSLCHDRSVVEFRKRVRVLLTAAQAMHRQLVELRGQSANLSAMPVGDNLRGTVTAGSFPRNF